MERKTERQKICRKSKCHGAFRARIDLGRYHVSSDVISPSKNVDFIDSKQPLRTDRAWHIVAAGKPISAGVYHCAIVGADEAVAEAIRINDLHWRAARSGKRGYVVLNDVEVAAGVAEAA
jgi:hypothetical protein